MDLPDSEARARFGGASVSASVSASVGPSLPRPMPQPRRRLPLRLLASALLLAACGGEQVLLPASPTPVVGPTWYLHAANDTTLPARIAARVIGVVAEETYLDSATITLDSAGTYEQRYWMRVFLAGALDRADAVVDRGSWTESLGTYTLTSGLRTRALTLTSPDTGRLLSAERMVTYLTAPTTAGLYRRSRP